MSPTEVVPLADVPAVAGGRRSRLAATAPLPASSPRLAATGRGGTKDRSQQIAATCRVVGDVGGNRAGYRPVNVTPAATNAACHDPKCLRAAERTAWSS